MIPEEGPPFIVMCGGGGWQVLQRATVVDLSGSFREVYMPVPDQDWSDFSSAARAADVLTESLGNR